MIFPIIADTFFWVAVVGCSLQLLGIVCLIIFYFHKAPPLKKRSGSYPGITMIKCCVNAFDNEEENFDVFFRQDYPGPQQLIFTVPDLSAPVVPVIQSYLAKYPDADAQMLVSTTREALWKKVDAIHDGMQVAKHPIVLLSDSDSVVHENYFSENVACLEDADTSLVTIPQYDFRMNTFGSALKLGNTCDLATFVMISWAFSKSPRFGWGHSMAFWKDDFDSFGEYTWSYLNDFLADDVAIPNLFTVHGLKVRFANIFCPVQYSNKTVNDVVQQKRRWAWCQKIVIPNKWLYLLATMVYPQVPATLAVLFSGFAPWSLAFWLGCAGVRVLVSTAHELLFQKSLKTNLRYFWTIVLWDLGQVFFVLETFFSDTIDFNGKRYRVVNRYFLDRVPL
ncbi:MAG: glycosyltransferase [Bdellovibrionaceae bacterium]|nr:glycosyltransferase [Bdellovibrionales bacterium]MCB9255066.1 glycosyltransferase [Pseudobdellovibrionaceae bacterium]